MVEEMAAGASGPEFLSVAMDQGCMEVWKNRRSPGSVNWAVDRTIKNTAISGCQ
jgi:hypothetical protein